MKTNNEKDRIEKNMGRHLLVEESQHFLVYGRYTSDLERLQNLRRNAHDYLEAQIKKRAQEITEHNIEKREANSDDIKSIIKNDPEIKRLIDLQCINKLDMSAKRLKEAAGVTFVFLHASQSGFTFYTEHREGKGKKFYFHD